MNFVNKKPSRVLLLLSLLTAAVMVFAACTTTDGVVVEDPVVQDPVVEDPVVEDEDIVEGEVVQEVTPIPEGESTTPGVAAIQDVMLDATRLLDFDLENANDEDLGDIQNLLVDMETGNIPYVIVESNGFLGFGNEDVLFPMDAFSLGEEGGELILPFAQPEDIEGAPVVDEETWALNDGTWDDELFNFWGGTDYGTNLTDFQSGAVLLSDLVGYGTAAWGDLGPGLVNAILVDLGENTAKWVVVDYANSGIADYNDNVVLVPFQAFDWTNMETELGFSADLDPEALNNAPLVNRDQLFAADFLDPEFDSQAVTYWEEMGYSFE